MALTLVVNRGVRSDVATLPDMVTYHVLAAGTVLWLLASAGTTDSHLPAILTASLTVGALLLNRMIRSRREKL
jgi:fibrillarin-like rRNA methylase